MALAAAARVRACCAARLAADAVATDFFGVAGALTTGVTTFAGGGVDCHGVAAVGAAADETIGAGAAAGAEATGAGPAGFFLPVLGRV